MDKFEGTIPQPNVDAMREEHSAPTVERILRQELERRKEVAINCWHLNEHESAAMWKVYVKSNEGIAVQSTVRRLCNALKKDQSTWVFVGMVQYIDYKEDSIPLHNVFLPFLCKRKSFEYEHELRALAVKGTVDDAGEFCMGCGGFQTEGIPVDVDLDELVANVFVAPESDPWIQDLVSTVMRRYRLKMPIKQSDLETGPLY